MESISEFSDSHSSCTSSEERKNSSPELSPQNKKNMNASYTRFKEEDDDDKNETKNDEKDQKDY